VMAEEMNFDDEIRHLLKRKPFVPFFVDLRNGERIKVADSHQMAIIESNNTVAILHPRPDGIFVRKDQIVGVDELTV
ncbi:MAG TPA: hypothetical protein VKK61_03805, partial [Tepidisphaeraceae bacterium]|nr:hypothetical protein [Tepidisphaeraceae bacterium]